MLSDNDRSILLSGAIYWRDDALKSMARAADDGDVNKLRSLLEQYDACEALARIVSHVTEIESDS